MRRWSRVAFVVVIAAAPLTVGTAQAQQGSWAYDQTKQIANAGRSESFDATVKVSRTSNLFNRQQVAIDLDGFKPTYNANNIVNNGTYLEYPVVVMQCRGTDPTPETCANERRSVYYPGYDKAASQDWRDRARLLAGPGNTTGIPGADFNEKMRNLLTIEQVPFVAQDGTNYLWEGTVDATGQPWLDEPARKSYPPPDTADAGTSVLATRSVPIRTDGGAEFLFEVRQRVSQPSLGCTDTEKCSIVVVPVMDMACAEGAPAECGGAPLGTEPGGAAGGTNTINNWVSQREWLAESNWRNRFVVPIEFAPDPDTCSVHDQRPILPVFGSELADVAQQRWGSAYCAGLRSADYLPLYTQGSEYDGRRQFTTMLGDSYGQNAVLTTQPVTDSPRPVVHAPSALTGFTVAFTADDADGRQIQEMTLSPRLLAKLLTQSYTPSKVTDAIRNARTRFTGAPDQVAAITAAGNGNGFYWEHPALFHNPSSIWEDQEFVALNPDLKLRNSRGVLADQFQTYLAPVVFQVQSDIIVDLTRYIVADPVARAWLDGKADEQGMVVNPVWQGTGEYELYSLLDQEARPPKPHRPDSSEQQPQYYNVPGAGDECDGQFGTPLLTRQANITNSAEASATALLDRRGSATPICGFTDVPTQNGDLDRIYSETKVTPADFGKRAMLSVTTVPHARLYELPTAKLVNAGGQAVAPDPGTMVNALGAAVQDKTTGTIELDYGRVTGNAYPGTMIAFTAVPSSGMSTGVAAQYADFIEFMATDGQHPGENITDLPPGYDPLTPNLRQQALDAARAVREQKGEVPPPPEDGPLGDGPGTNTDSTVDNLNGNANSGVGPAQTADDEAKEGDPRSVAQTRGAGSWWSRWTLPLLFGLGVLAALAAFVVGAATRHDHPVRRLIRTALRR
ncbi:hypothetical protein [Actinophytocola oryzae]|uniref:Uncharacterized protein n=1 Tax=Actinophytocola oryzae TaxID=502181 RepID=A0A4R7VUK5_9PSEU|nr:hypothetical protein [Actinophytocola oryzae]TDV53653.1 hypothetical protein CLV71_104121 [Actinophytocola oryzae]